MQDIEHNESNDATKMSPPFLSVVTRSCSRTELLTRNRKSLVTQIDPDYEHVIILDKKDKSFNENKHRVKGQYVFILDDDNYVSDVHFIRHLKNVVSQHKVDIILFKAHRKPFSQTLPSKRVWGKQPILGGIDSCCFVVKRAIWQRHIHEFGQPKHGGYLFIKALFDKGYSRYWVSKTMVMIPRIGSGKCRPTKAKVVPKAKKKIRVLSKPKKVVVSANIEKVYAQVTVVLTNYCTKMLTQEALRTMLLYYPKIPLILIDNNSKDDSTEYIKTVGKKYANITAILNKRNLGHGPAMNIGIRLAKTPYIFLYDSDASLKRAGLLEAMLAEFAKNPKKLYALGWLRKVDKFSGVSTTSGGMSYVHPHAAIIDRRKFLQLTPMEHSGAPCTGNMRTALAKGFQLKNFPIGNYVKHLIAGTRRRFGGHWKPGAAARPKAWKSKDCYPI